MTIAPNSSSLNFSIQALLQRIASIVVGKDDVIRLSVTCLLARGHLLIEDIPGVGKTTLAHALASAAGLEFRRIQFTSDLLPGDVIGSSVFHREEKRFVFHPGPLFAQVVVIDEINRATPKTQSALLEAMEERQVTVDGVPHSLPEPFFVVATQNPQEQVGTFPLPESQLDRFLMRVSLGLPDRSAERALLQGRDRREMLAEVASALQESELRQLQEAVLKVHASDALVDYLQDILVLCRQRHRLGLSPRAGLGLLRAAKSWALVANRDAVLPEDIQAVGDSVMAHRLDSPFDPAAPDGRDLVRDILRAVPVP
jgi:MoxR-like ATPase